MTYCVGIKLDAGIVFLSDSRTNAGVDHVRTFRKTHRFERPGERTIVVQTAGNLALSQAVLSALRTAFQPEALRRDAVEREDDVRRGDRRRRGRAQRVPARLGGDAELRPRVQLEPHRRRPDSRRASAALQRLQRRQLHRVDGRKRRTSSSAKRSTANRSSIASSRRTCRCTKPRSARSSRWTRR